MGLVELLLGQEQAPGLGSFDRLYHDWSTLERFHRTRGVLRLMATVVHALWVRGDQSALIMPASIPLDDTKVFEEITSYLDDPWKPIVDADIAGSGSTAHGIDTDNPLLGRSMAGKRVARVVFVGTAPSVSKNARTGGCGAIGGIEQKRVVLGATYPTDNPAHITDALRHLADRGKYMNCDQDRYWLSLQQTVSRLVQEIADGYDVPEIHAELTRILRKENDRGVFARVHRVPDGTADVDDEATAALVIFGLDRCHSKKASLRPLTPRRNSSHAVAASLASTRTRWSSSPPTLTGSTRSNRCSDARWPGSG